jgi:hypothetical protein
MRPSHQEYLTPAWVRFTLTIPGQNYIDAYNVYGITAFLSARLLSSVIFASVT